MTALIQTIASYWFLFLSKIRKAPPATQPVTVTQAPPAEPVVVNVTVEEHPDTAEVASTTSEGTVEAN